jgi:hypothetical protein
VFDFRDDFVRPNSETTPVLEVKPPMLEATAPMLEAARDCERLSSTRVGCCLLETLITFGDDAFKTFSRACSSSRNAGFGVSAVTARFLAQLPDVIMEISTQPIDGIVECALVQLLAPPPIVRRSAHDLHVQRLIGRVYLDLIITDGLGRSIGLLRRLVDASASVYADLEIRAKIILSLLLLGVSHKMKDQLKIVDKAWLSDLALCLHRITGTQEPIACDGEPGIPLT